MDFIDIVLVGYFTPNDREHLAKYFIRQLKEAEKNNYDSEVFFDGCLRVIEAFENHSKSRFHERQRELFSIMGAARDEAIIFEVPDSDKDYKEQCQQTIDNCEKELNNSTFKDYPVHLFSVTAGKYAYNMGFNEVYFIRDAILEAMEKSRPTEMRTEPVAIAPPPPEIKPIFKSEAIETIFNLLKDHFSHEQQPRLEELLNTGNNVSEPLIFLGKGNRLADAFKRLIEKDFITGCQKKELQNWIYTNFQYLDNVTRKPKEYNPRTLEDIISGNKAPCKNPLFKIELDKATGEQLIRKT